MCNIFALFQLILTKVGFRQRLLIRECIDCIVHIELHTIIMHRIRVICRFMSFQLRTCWTICRQPAVARVYTRRYEINVSLNWAIPHYNWTKTEQKLIHYSFWFVHSFRLQSHGNVRRMGVGTRRTTNTSEYERQHARILFIIIISYEMVWQGNSTARKRYSKICFQFVPIQVNRRKVQSNAMRGCEMQV